MALRETRNRADQGRFYTWPILGLRLSVGNALYPATERACGYLEHALGELTPPT